MKHWPGFVRILLDTNIIVAGFLTPKGPPGRLLLAWLQGRFLLVTSQEQLDELARVLSYERIKSRIDPEQAQDFLDNVAVLAVMASKLPVLELSPDPSDNVILATAVAGQADLLVSGDKTDVLALGAVEGVSIVTATEALARLGMIEE